MADVSVNDSAGDCILFATADWDEPYWTNKQHTARALVNLGWRVLYVESVGLRSPQVGSGKDWKRLWIRLRKGLACLLVGAPKREAGLWVLSPLAIPAAHGRPWLGWINRTLLRWVLIRHINHQGFKRPLIWTYHPFLLSTIDGVDHGPLLYHCVDDLAAVPGVDIAAFREAEDSLLRKSDAVFTTSQPLADRCKQVNPNTYFLPNVVDTEHFAKAAQPGPLPDDLAAIPEPRLGYHGVLTDFKIDFPLLYECAKIRPDWHWVLIGEEREGQKSQLVAMLAQLPNVHLLGYRSYQSLPDYLRGMQVGLLPSLQNTYTRSMFPMKYFEFLAAGLPVVATPLVFTETHKAGVEVARTAGDFVLAIERQLERGRLGDDEIRNMVGENTWSERTKKMLAAVVG